MVKINKELAYGSAPNLKGLDVNSEAYRMAYARAINWLNEAYEVDDRQEMTLKVLASRGVDLAPYKAIESWRYSQVGNIAWMLIEEQPLAVQSVEWFNNKLVELKQMGMKVLEANKRAAELAPKPRDPMLDFYAAYGELEDTLLENRLDDAYNVLVTWKSKQGVLAYMKGRVEENLEALRHTDKHPDLFADESEDWIKEKLAGYNRIMKDIESVEHNKRAIRKRRAKKAPKVVKQVANVNYKKEDKSLKLVSVEPANVVGTKAALVYNTKVRKVAMLLAEEGKTLTIQGTTIRNVDEEASISKTLRKPEQQIPMFRDATMKRVQILMEKNIKGKVFGATGRLNNDTLILKVFK